MKNPHRCTPNAAGSPRRGLLSIAVGEAARSDDEPTEHPTLQGTPPKGTPIAQPVDQ
ncbi:hypothetical protein [Alloprevotella sp. Lung230]|uniref:hypothetical protein n=1 Tax=Alloprevotella sp. Lung230 TaxID=2766595 RepID=UPI001655C413|nr:hypothetical protein [Alloprevotella sp. Lung230]MBC8625854.1 hypothetical protein [Alloprevotella sp. Lung230]